MRIALIIVVVVAAMIGSGWFIAMHTTLVLGVIGGLYVGALVLRLIDKLTFTVPP